MAAAEARLSQFPFSDEEGPLLATQLGSVNTWNELNGRANMITLIEMLFRLTEIQSTNHASYAGAILSSRTSSDANFERNPGAAISLLA